MSAKANPNQKKVFQEDAFLHEPMQDDQDDEQLLQPSPHQPPSHHARNELGKLPAEEEYQQKIEISRTLEDLIYKLNDEDHSEDEGIEDYKIGGYHPCHIGEVLINRYVLIQKLGWGHFSTVWLAKDFKYGNYAAVKIMKSSPHYLEASYDQVEILQKVASNAYHPEWIKSLKEYQKGKEKFDRDDSHVLNLLNSFLYKGPYGNHFCMVFEILGVNLLEVLKRYDYKGLPLDLVKQITRQVLMGLDFLNRICRVIHTDLKPENVLLCLTDDEIKKIVQDGQLSNKQLYRDRLKLYRTKYHLGPADFTQDQEEKFEKVEQLNQSQSEVNQSSTGMSISFKIQQIQLKLKEDKTLNQNQKRNYRKKLKKLQQKAQKEQKPHPKVQQKQPKIKKEKTAKQLFTAFDTKLVLDKGPKLQKGFKVKIADLGNACWQHHHFATQIQTRQYRGPEVLTGSKYSLSADMWSLACMTFQMLTGELLFNPRKDNSEVFGKNDDHLAQMMELLGRFPKKFSTRGAKSKKYFSKEGSLNRIPKLQNWSLKDVMIAKYRFTEDQAEFFQNFMTPMLNCYPQRRILPQEMLKHIWLYTKSPENYFLSPQQHERIKAQRYDLQAQKQEICQYESQKQDGSIQDNTGADSSDDEFFGYQKKGDIRYIDRSFMDLGYIGYGDGIYLDKLDTGPNWQFA